MILRSRTPTSNSCQRLNDRADTRSRSCGVAAPISPHASARGGVVDVVILPSNLIDDLVAEGKLASGSRVDLVKSPMSGRCQSGLEPF